MPRTSNPRTKYRNRSTTSPLNADRGNTPKGRIFSMGFWRMLLGTSSLPISTGTGGTQAGSANSEPETEAAESVRPYERSNSPPAEQLKLVGGLSEAKVLRWLASGTGDFEEPDTIGHPEAQIAAMPGSFVGGSFKGYETDGTASKGSESSSEYGTPSLDLHWGSRSTTEARLRAGPGGDDWEAETERDSRSRSRSRSPANARMLEADDWETATERDTRSPSPAHGSEDTSREGTPVKSAWPELSAANSFDTLVVLEPLLRNAPAGGRARVEHFQAKFKKTYPDATPTEVDHDESSDAD